MRRFCSVVLAAALIFATMPVQAATVLTDREIEGVTASGVQINPSVVTDSALATQSNIGAIIGSDVITTAMVNSNVATVTNLFGNSAAALQSNIGVIAAIDDVSCSTDTASITNTNVATVTNTGLSIGEPIGIDAANLDLDVDGIGLDINAAELYYSAAAFQSNIGAIISSECQLDSTISNTNTATVSNLPVAAGSSAAAAQSNIAAAVSLNNAIDGVSIINSNTATVTNGPDAVLNGAIAEYDIEGSNIDIGPLVINPVPVYDAAIASQNNLAAIYADGDVTDASIISTNVATVTNSQNSAAALQDNVAAVIAANGLFDVGTMHNTNNAVVTNTVQTDLLETGSIDTENIDLEFDGIDLDINSADIYDSAAALQNNIGLIFADTHLHNAAMINSNVATVTNTGDSAAALQSNIGAMLGGECVFASSMENANTATVTNTVTTPNNTIDASNISVNDLFFLNPLLMSSSAAALQSNIAALLTEGDINDSTINNVNVAAVVNTGDSAVALQSNIGVMACLDDIDGNTMTNTNTATVTNTVVPVLVPEQLNEIDSGVEAATIELFGAPLNPVTAQSSAVASQSNIGVIYGDVISNNVMTNSNTATVTNNVGITVSR